MAKADDADPEKIEAVNDGSDSPLQGAGYGLYSIWGRPARLPMSVRRERVAEKFVEDGVIVKPTELAMAMRVFESKERQKTKRRTRWSAR